MNLIADFIESLEIRLWSISELYKTLTNITSSCIILVEKKFWKSYRTQYIFAFYRTSNPPWISHASTLGWLKFFYLHNLFWFRLQSLHQKISMSSSWTMTTIPLEFPWQVLTKKDNWQTSITWKWWIWEEREQEFYDF